MAVEDGGDQGPGLGGRLHEGHILESTLDLGPLAALGAVHSDQVILEGEMLQGQQEDGQPRPLPGLGKLLQQVGVGVAAVADGLQVLAELVDHHQQRPVGGQGPGHLHQRGGRRTGSAGVVGGCVLHGPPQRVGGLELRRRGDPAEAADHGTVQSPQDGATQRLAAGGDQPPVESRLVSPVALVAGRDHLGCGWRGLCDQLEGDLPRGRVAAPGRVEEQGQRRLARPVRPGERPRPARRSAGSSRGHPLHHVEGPGGDHVSVQGLGGGDVALDVGRAREPTGDPDVIGQHGHYRSPAMDSDSAESLRNGLARLSRGCSRPAMDSDSAESLRDLAVGVVSAITDLPRWTVTRPQACASSPTRCARCPDAPPSRRRSGRRPKGRPPRRRPRCRSGVPGSRWR